MDTRLRILADYACHTGEGPLWHPEENALFWTDIPNGRLYRFDWSTGEPRTIYEGRPVGGMTLEEDGSLLLFRDGGNVVRWWNGLERVVIEEVPDDSQTRFNDVIADPEGRVFCGTMSSQDRPGRLFRLDPDRTLHLVLEGLGTPNGMGFSPDLSQMFFTDSGARTIYRFDYHRPSGRLSHQIPFLQVEPGVGSPDGMTVDAEGCVWSAFWDGSRVARYSGEGQEVERVTLPVKKVSCPIFGGPGYATLFLTTAGGHQKELDGEHAGALFAFEPGVVGRPEFRSRIE
ncbi:MAG TPA: SMP-30/gluconolactonase/LRE family protein [Fimbriimonadaceae bacterium]|nr:SMP-30/gluconolactonase/LRE family protein [Fimbriimonadaceae bacterium]